MIVTIKYLNVILLTQDDNLNNLESVIMGGIRNDFRVKHKANKPR